MGSSVVQPVEFSAVALAYVDDVCAVAKVLSAHVRAAWPRDFRNEVIVHGKLIRFRIDEEQIFVTEAVPVDHTTC
jgi:hypothetical protein